MTQVAARPLYWIKRSHFPKTRYYVRAWGSDRHPDLNYEATEVPSGLHHRYPFVDVTPIEPRPAPHVMPKEATNGQAQS